MPDQIFFSSWAELGRELVVGSLAYLGVLLLLRVAGQQALTKMTAYGLVVTVALGSTLATALLSPQVTLDKALLGFALLLGLQRVLAWLSRRSPAIRSLINNDPVLLVNRGQIVEAAMRNTNMTESGLRSALRSAHRATVDQVAAAVLETDGSVSVVPFPSATERRPERSARADRKQARDGG